MVAKTDQLSQLSSALPYHMNHVHVSSLIFEKRKVHKEHESFRGWTLNAR